MTDLHTHILPGMDDGAKTAEESIAMLRLQWEHGVDTVVLTPHFYPTKESVEQFLARRDAAFAQMMAAVRCLPEEEQNMFPRLILGAEVAYVPGLEEMQGLQRLCIGNTKNMLLELPFFAWSNMLIRQLYHFIERVGVTPILAHIERYFACQEKKLLNEVMALGLPVQVGTDILSGAFSPVMKLLRKGQAHLVASDCHDLLRRVPNLGQALAQVEKKLGRQRLEELTELADQLADC